MGDTELALCRLAFEQRHADALTRAEKLKARLTAEASSHLSVADQQMRAAESGIDWRYTGADTFVVPVEQATVSLLLADAALYSLAELEAILAKHGKRRLDAAGPTAELVAQVAASKKGNPLARLYALEHIDADELRHANEIAALVSHVAKRQGAKTMNWPTSSVPGEEESRKMTAAESAEWMALLHAFVYLPWADRVRTDLPLIHGLVVDGDSLTVLARRHGMRWGTALLRIKAGLAEYGRIRHRYLKAGPDATGRVLPPGVPPMREVVRGNPRATAANPA